MTQTIASEKGAIASASSDRPPDESPGALGTSGMRDSENVPLVVDLDGTLLKTDLLHESILRIARHRPLALFSVLSSLFRGRAALKQRVAELAVINASTLPFNNELLAWLREEKQHRRKLTLATAANQQQAAQVVKELNLFDAVLGSSTEINLKGRAKLAVVRERCGTVFDYVGNSAADLEVWKASRQAIVVGGQKKIERKARDCAHVVRTFPAAKENIGVLTRVLRVYQWSKNVLIFVPSFTSHSWLNPSILLHCLVAFVAFNFAASATYIANDLLDLEEDRLSSVKRHRALAAGECTIRTGVILCAFCFLVAFGIGAVAGTKLFSMLVLYTCGTLLYSFRLKTLLVLDVLTLAMLYTLRIIVGHVVTGITFSMWLLSFSFFLFLSLALCKRAAELVRHEREGQTGVPGRGYLVGDLRVISAAGIASGFLSCLVLALYINSSSVTLLYRRPVLLWGVLPLLLFYLLRIWIICERGELDADPIIYTAESKVTYCIAGVVLLLVALATVRF